MEVTFNVITMWLIYVNCMITRGVTFGMEVDQRSPYIVNCVHNEYNEKVSKKTCSWFHCNSLKIQYFFILYIFCLYNL